MYEVWQAGGDLKGLLKTYPLKIQAIIYCYLKGFVYYAKGKLYLQDDIEIKEK